MENIENEPQMKEDSNVVEQHKNTLMAVLPYLGVLILIPLLTDAKKDPFVKFHIKQGLVLIIFIVFGILLEYIPLLFLFSPIIFIVAFILEIIGIINAVKGKMKKLPIIGTWGESLNI